MIKIIELYQYYKIYLITIKLYITLKYIGIAQDEVDEMIDNFLL